VDSESGGAKGHYPNCTTAQRREGSFTRRKNCLGRFFRQPAAVAPVEAERGALPVSKPPESTPHSDIDGVHQDEERNTKVAADVGEGTRDLKRAHDDSQGRPPYADDAGEGSGEAEAHPS
jgi:hypothetical protein